MNNIENLFIYVSWRKCWGWFLIGKWTSLGLEFQMLSWRKVHLSFTLLHKFDRPKIHVKYVLNSESFNTIKFKRISSIFHSINFYNHHTIPISTPKKIATKEKIATKTNLQLKYLNFQLRVNWEENCKFNIFTSIWIKKIISIFFVCSRFSWLFIYQMLPVTYIDQ